MICADPNDTLPMTLKTSEHLPEDQRPTFFVRFITASEMRELRRLIRAAEAETDDDKASEIIDRAIRIGVVGCRNVKFRSNPLAFEEIKRFDDILSAAEVWDLAIGQISKMTLTESDRFKSALQKKSDAASSADTATGNVSNPQPS